MKLNIPKEDLTNFGPPPPIFYKPDPNVSKNPEDNSDSLRVNIKTQPGKSNNETVVIYVLLFQTGSLEALLKFFMIITNIIRSQDLSTGHHKFGVTRNLVVGEALQVFEQKTCGRVTDKNANYILVMKDLIARFFPPKSLQIQKRYLQRGMYKPRKTKI